MITKALGRNDMDFSDAPSTKDLHHQSTMDEDSLRIGNLSDREFDVPDFSSEPLRCGSGTGSGSGSGSGCGSGSGSGGIS
jgi:hypothetical protein